MRHHSSARRLPHFLASLALTLVVVGLPLGIYVWGSHSSVFAIRHVQVLGAKRVPQPRAVELLSRQFVGRNLFTVRTVDVARTLSPLMYLASVKIDRDFPDTLRVTVGEHQPAAFVLAAGEWYLVSTEAYVLTRIGTEKRATQAALLAGPEKVKLRLPAMPAEQALQPRRHVQEELVLDALAVLRAIPPKVRSDVVLVRSSAIGYRVRLRGGAAVIVGGAESLRAKGLALDAVLAYYAARRTTITFVDVSVPDRPLARPML